MTKNDLRDYLEDSIKDLRKMAEEGLWRALDAQDQHEQEKWLERAEGAELSIEYCQKRLADLI